MLDIRLIRKNPEEIEKKLRTKQPDLTLAPLLVLDERIRSIKTEVEALKAERNSLSKGIGERKKNKQDASNEMEKVSTLGDQIFLLDKELKELEEKFLFDLASLPNLPDEGIKISSDPKENVCIKSVREKPTFSFPFKNHVELAERHHLLDFKKGAKIGGSGWPVYEGVGAELEWALINYMIQIHLKNGFKFYLPPLLAKKEILFGAGLLPKFEKQLFKLTDDDYELYLIPTAEPVLNALHNDETLDEEMLPLKYVSYTPCFRREAGAAGSQERGLIRMHQFNKVEMFCFASPEESNALFDTMMESAEEVLEGLGLHYRNMLLVTGDMSFAASKTVDIEVWLPGQNRYYEVSSVSNCRDFQARRSGTRFRTKEGKTEFLHTLNGSGVATSRLMVALLENNQQEDGSIKVPEVLQKYLRGRKIIS